MSEERYPVGYNDSHWEPGENITEAPCHPGNKLYAWSCDGNMVGSCPVCQANCVRIKYGTGVIERPKGPAASVQSPAGGNPHA